MVHGGKIHISEKHPLILSAEVIDETGAEVILSSSWRYTYGRYAYEGFTGEDNDMKELLEKLDMYGIKIPGITPRYFNEPDGRPFEIRSWLCHRPEVENFVILDDECVEKAIKILGKRKFY